ncbi:MAG: COX15/CtaA family protein, partial [Myxococcaceae bacterium]
MTNILFKGSLFTLIFMILGMVILGGLTRLTGSGLSIVEWKPITGIFPPFSLEGWLYEFGKYQQSPEFQKINASMTLADFQSIFWLEYIHRLGGRLLGLVLFIPTFLMVIKKYRRDLWPYLALLWILGAAQGLMGW